MILILIPIYINTNATINIVSPKCSVQWLSSYLWSLLLIVPASHNSSARFSYNLYIVNTTVHGKQSVCFNPCHRNTNFVFHLLSLMVRSCAGACHSCANMYHCKWVLLLCECVPLVCVCVWHNLCYNLTRIRGTRPTVTPLGAPSSSPTSSPSSKCTSSSPLSTSGARRRTVNLPNRDECPREKWLPRPTPAENFQGYPGPPRKCPEFVYHPAPRILLPSPNKKGCPVHPCSIGTPQSS